MTGIWSAQDAAKATGGKVHSHWQVSSVVIDSRLAGPGSLFIALKGEKLDGHDFVADVLKQGAAAMVSHVPENIPENAPLLLVRDCIQALADLAAFNRRRSHARIIAVTGSVGKTSTKEALKCALSSAGKTYASSGNFNNHLGVPISMAQMGADADFAVFEMGMNHAGEIAALTRQVRPSIAIITTVDAVHLEFFNSVSAIADAKAEIFLGMDHSGTAILNKDNAYFDHLAQAALSHGVGHIISFGSHPDALCRLVEYAPEGQGCRIRACIAGQDIRYHLQATGMHHALNSVAALAAVYAAGEDITKAAAALSLFATPEGRGSQYPGIIDHKPYTLIDDSYNASPTSVKAALDVLGHTKDGRKLAILGDMRELGESAPLLHQNLLDDILRNQIDAVITVGSMMHHLYTHLPPALQLGHYPDVDTLMLSLADAIKPNDTLLIKGSHGVGMFRLVEFLNQNTTQELSIVN